MTSYDDNCLFSGEVGGQMGLCLGASLITVVELFDFISNIIWHYCCQSKKNRKQITVQSLDAEKGLKY